MESVCIIPVLIAMLCNGVKGERKMKDLNRLHPWMKTQAETLKVRSKLELGIDIIITQTLRTKTEQDELWAQGRTTPGVKVTNAKYPQSMHCWGLAFDFVPVIGGKAIWNKPDLFKKIGALGKSMGLTWGGDFKSLKDMPHFEAPNHDWKELQAKYGTPEKYIATWGK